MPVEDITLVDFLPPQLTFISAEGDGQFGRYDAQSHTYVWSIASLAAGESLCLEIVTQVRAGTPAGTTIVNRATVDNDQIEATTDKIEVTVRPVDRVLNVTKRISAGATTDDGKTLYVGIGTEITYEIGFDSNGSSHRVEGLSLVDVLPPEVTFVAADGDRIDDVKFEPGQVAVLSVTGVGEAYMAIASAPDVRHRLEFLVKTKVPSARDCSISVTSQTCRSCGSRATDSRWINSGGATSCS